jgi:hypothetical protein
MGLVIQELEKIETQHGDNELGERVVTPAAWES